MGDLQRSYYAIIPANVRYDTELTANAKLLYGEITALCNERGFCWATNDYFANLYGVSKTSISKWISALIKKGYINSEIIYKEGTKEILNRYLRIVNYPIEEKLNTPIEEKLKDNNTIINNTINNKKERKKETTYDDIIKSMVNDEDIIDALNEFIKMRKLIKKPMTDRALKQLINRLYELSSDKEEQLKILDNSIINNWSSIYPLKKENKSSYNKPVREEIKPDWLGKEPEVKEATPEQQERIEALQRRLREKYGKDDSNT